MSIREQFDTIKENWLMIILILVAIIFLSGDGVIKNGLNAMTNTGQSIDGGYEIADSNIMRYPGISDDFAPEIEDRKIVKSSSLSNEIERGKFDEADVQLKNIISSSGAYLLSERVNVNGEGWRAYYSGHYGLKIETNKYNDVLSQLKEIGEVQDFNENADDVTGRYDDLEIELSVEKERLARYIEMYSKAQEISDKIDLNDRIFDQERRIKYLEDSLDNIDKRIDYSSISFSMTEERSEYVNVALVKISSLIKTFVGNFNALLNLIFGIIPWAIVVFIGWLLWKRKKN